MSSDFTLDDFSLLVVLGDDIVNNFTGHIR
jgi:hypothetical protein